MFKSTRELKAFITWAKENHVKRVKMGDIEVEISDIAFIPEFNPPKLSQEASKLTETKPTTADNVQEEAKEDPDLYWSTSN